MFGSASSFSSHLRAGYGIGRARMPSVNGVLTRSEDLGIGGGSQSLGEVQGDAGLEVVPRKEHPAGVAGKDELDVVPEHPEALRGAGLPNAVLEDVAGVPVEVDPGARHDPGEVPLGEMLRPNVGDEAVVPVQVVGVGHQPPLQELAAQLGLRVGGEALDDAMVHPDLPDVAVGGPDVLLTVVRVPHDEATDDDDAGVPQRAHNSPRTAGLLALPEQLEVSFIAALDPKEDHLDAA